MFVVGRTYKNRRGRYVVLAIRGNVLDVKYEDGTTDALDSELQRRIIANMPPEGSSQTDGLVELNPRTDALHLPPLDWTRYDLWNASVFERFFAKEVSGRLVYIDVDEEELGIIAPDSQAAKAPARDFIQTMAGTLNSRRGHLIDRHFERLDDWKKRRGSMVPPPFMAILTLFCLTAQKMHRDQQFGANNYYDRLAEVLQGPKYTPDQKEALQAGFQRAHLLWVELDVWLRMQGGQYGLPSAQPMYGLSHVGYPISQALLRSYDRNKLPDFFAEADLEPGQEVSPADVERLMAPWVPSSPLSQAAKTSWKNGTARRRMAEVASLELRTWDGETPVQLSVQHPSSAMRIAVEARVQGGPRPRVSWDVVFRIRSDVSEVIYEADGGGKGLPGGGTHTTTATVTRGLGERWSAPIPGVSIADFLMMPVTMIERGGSHKAVWEPRKVVAFDWDDGLKTYRSQQRLQFGARSMVLAYRGIANRVGDVLTSVDAGSMHRVPESWGVPKDWVLFENIMLARIPDTGGDFDMAVLMPEIYSRVDLYSGISLPGRKQWLSSRLPKLRINSIDEFQRLLMTVDLKSSLADSRDVTTPPSFEALGNAMEADLSGLLGDGIYGLSVTAYRNTRDKNGEIVSQQTIEVRSPDSPLGRGPESLSHQSNRLGWTITAATPETEESERPLAYVSGAIVRPERELLTQAMDLPHELGISAGYDEEFIEPMRSLERALRGIADCFNNAHVFRLPTYHGVGPSHRQMTGECKFCGLKKVHPPVNLRKLLLAANARPQPDKQIVLEKEREIPEVVHESGSQKHDYDGLLDACFTLGGGKWPHFELLTRQVSDSPALPSEAVRLFSALGHIDVELDPTHTRFTQWKVAPSALVIAARGHAFLAGHRSPRLVDTVERAVRGMGGMLNPVPNADGPLAYLIVGLGNESFVAMLEKVNSDTRVRLTISNRPDRSIAGSLTPLRAVLAAAPTVAAPVLASYFDVAKCSWKPNAFATADGLYRTESMPVSYCLKVSETWCRVSYRVGKHLAAGLSGKSLLAYDVQNEQLECALGAQLPGLYERAAVLSSGLPPVVDLAKGRVIYRQVPKDVASAIWSALYARDFIKAVGRR